ncbi:hypothetical protein BDV96DRAFT_564046 [Lophiotrema nucula]|uniref:Heterokaryon incompatibility domain-containing protein n=1 Tax=Lophiotrema nucula TaxID=690887 RepID=A0A6A5ZPE9_9PLEO|nr:hypothetical protein BDV96DRAFT_564046 [Lophiotrema nucula]
MLNEPDTLDGHRAYEKKTHAIRVGGKNWQVLPDEVLDFCWNGGLDTPCSLCFEEFDIAVTPPVRTARLYRAPCIDSELERQLPSLEVLNTHLECIRKKGVKFFPISHAWHTPVADAYASRVANLGAASIIIDQPLDILLSLSATKRFDRDIQIWHDYISIPQWQDRFRGTSILPQIFRIFQLGKTALLQMDQELNLHALEAGNPKELTKLLSARWFTRLWPVVELNMCEDALIMNRGNKVSTCPLRSLVRSVAMLSSTIGMTIPSWVQSSISTTCLGHVYDIIATQGSRWYRDRFIAACAILEPSRYPSLLPQLPADAAEACLWLSKRSLERGDFSPLLLRPPTGETMHRKSGGMTVAWLKGHMRMEAKMWDLGPQIYPSTVVPRILGDTVAMDLHLVGSIVKSRNEHRDIYDISCHTCDETTTCPIDFWKEPGESAQLYHIPGLAYRDSGPDCIGLVIEEERAIGRSRFTDPSCHCKTLVLIRLA